MRVRRMGLALLSIITREYNLSFSDLLDCFLFATNCTSFDQRVSRIFVVSDSRFVQKIIHYVRAFANASPTWYHTDITAIFMGYNFYGIAIRECYT